MTIDRKQKLLDLDPETLVDALLELAIHSQEADQLIERLIATPKENVQRFKKKLSSLKHSNHFGWRDSAALSRELIMILEELKCGIKDPLDGIKHLETFYETDQYMFEISDDSSGHIGGIYRYNARELFVEYAKQCDDKSTILATLLKLIQKDSYGVRDSLIDCAGQFLSETDIRIMIDTFQKRSEDAKDEYGKRLHLQCIESLARQIKDAKLFETTRLGSSEKVSISAYIDIANVYYESEDLNTALMWLQKIPEGERFHAYEKDKLLMDIYRKQGDSDKLTNLLLQKFKSHHTMNTLNELLDVIGQENRDKIIDDEIETILTSDTLHYSDAQFLIDTGRTNEAEQYLLKQVTKLNGESYHHLLPMADALEKEKRYLIVSLIYRCLLLSILERAYTKSYPHGVRYLKKLDLLAELIHEWKTFDSHVVFKDNILQSHKRKSSFWSKYN